MASHRFRIPKVHRCGRSMGHPEEGSLCDLLQRQILGLLLGLQTFHRRNRPRKLAMD